MPFASGNGHHVSCSGCHFSPSGCFLVCRSWAYPQSFQAYCHIWPARSLAVLRSCHVVLVRPGRTLMVRTKIGHQGVLLFPVDINWFCVASQSHFPVCRDGSNNQCDSLVSDGSLCDGEFGLRLAGSRDQGQASNEDTSWPRDEYCSCSSPDLDEMDKMNFLVADTNDLRQRFNFVFIRYGFKPNAGPDVWAGQVWFCAAGLLFLPWAKILSGNSVCNDGRRAGSRATAFQPPVSGRAGVRR